MAIRFSLFIVLLVGILSCKQGPRKKSTPPSSGRINHVNVVLEKEAWQGAVGDVLRKYFAAPVQGLQQDEPLFTLKHIAVDAFKGFAKENRTIIKVGIADSSGVFIKENVYAKPQLDVFISGSSSEELVGLIEENAVNIITTIKTNELRTDKKRIARSLKPDDSLRKNLGVSLKFPSVYRYAKEDPDFYWMRKPLSNGDINILVYEVPFRVIDQDTNTVLRLVRMRDSIGGKKIPVDEGRFITERAFAPSLYKTEIDGRFAWQTKGTWEVRGQRMAGPFVNYAIKDVKNERYLVIEGFIFSPSQEKRDNMFELEAIIQSARFVEETDL